MVSRKLLGKMTFRVFCILFKTQRDIYIPGIHMSGKIRVHQIQTVSGLLLDTLSTMSLVLCPSALLGVLNQLF